jgi:hypothetical protein
VKRVEFHRIGPNVPHGILNMEIRQSIQCSFCGQDFDLVFDTSTPTQWLTMDLEVCCRPFEVLAECEPDEILSLEAQGAG